MYHVKEIFHTLQGEGARAGRASVFVRFSGCNLWSGLERDRSLAICQFCDTEFVGTDGTGGGKFLHAEELAQALWSHWPASAKGVPYAVCTGGEPALQLDLELISALKTKGFEIAVETNGTVALPAGLDWICVSPKAGTQLSVRTGSELKLVFPQSGAEPELFEHLEFANFFLQPMDGLHLEANTRAAIEYCKTHPQWRLSLQTHKWLGIR